MKIEAISYGKSNVTVYRTNAAPLTGLAPLPESNFTGRSNALFANDVGVLVLGDNFKPAYTEGDNQNVVATDSMKNFILKKGLEFSGSTLEGLLHFLGREFLTRYPHMEALEMSGTEVPFEAATVPQDGAFGKSETLFYPTDADRGYAEVGLQRSGDDAVVTRHRAGRLGFKLVKVTGSSFYSFVRDEHTTLPERVDRALYLYLDCCWRYRDVTNMISDDKKHFVASEQVRDVLRSVFHEFNSKSIQHLFHEMGERVLQRFPQLAELSFEGQNRTWDVMFENDADPTTKTMCDPRPPYGVIGLTLTQND